MRVVRAIGLGIGFLLLVWMLQVALYLLGLNPIVGFFVAVAVVTFAIIVDRRKSPREDQPQTHF